MIQYPRKFERDHRADPKKVLLIDPPTPYLYDCQNCGGLGQMSAFIVSKGPSQFPIPLDKNEVLKSVIDEHYGWLWYKGITLDLPCPVCDGLGGNVEKKRPAPMSAREYAELNPMARIKDLADQKSVKKQGVYRDHK